MIEKVEELILIIHIISKRNDSVNIILLCSLHDRVSILFIIYYFIHFFIRASKYSKATYKLRQLVNDWGNLFKNKKYFYSRSFHMDKLFAEGEI